MTKRILAILLAMVLLISASASALELNAPGEFPLVKEGTDVTLTIGLPLQVECTDYVDNYYTKLLIEKTGVKIEFELLPSDGNEAKEKVNMMIAANQELPDILNIGFGDLERAEYGAGGYLVDLMPYIESDGYYFKQSAEAWLTEKEYANMMSYGKSPDGGMYAMPTYSSTIDSSSAQAMWINKNWLDKLGLEVPTTTEELYNVLVAFRDKDPNGNNIADEIPMTGATGWAGDAVAMLLNSFLYYCYNGGFGYQLNAENGQLIAPFTQEAFREGLRFVNKLYTEGLLSPLSFTQSTAELRTIMTAPATDPTLVGAFVSHPSSVFGGTGDIERVKEYIAVPAMIGPEGIAYTAHYANLPQYTVSITKDCAEPQLAFRLLDAMREQTMNLSGRFGEENVDWHYVNEGKIFVEIEGYEPMFMETTDTRPSPWSSANNIIWGTTSFFLLSNKMMGGRVAPEWPTELRAYQMQTLWYDSVPLRNGKCPEEIPEKIVMTAAELESISEISSSLHSYVNDSTSQFVTGSLSLDADWDNYLATIDSIGLDYFMEVNQKAYDRMNGK